MRGRIQDSRSEDMERHCLGCGVSLNSKKSYERRTLWCNDGLNVRQVWEDIMSSEHGNEIDLVRFVGTPTNPGYMCRSCFDMYKRMSKLRNELHERAREALARVIAISQPRDSTRKRIADFEQPPPKRLFHGPEKDNASPSVMVSCYLTL